MHSRSPRSRPEATVVAVLPALRCRAVGVRQQRRVQEGESVAHRRRRRQNHRRRDHGESFGARSWPFPPYDHGRYTSRGLMPGQIEVVWCEFSSLDSDGSTQRCTGSYYAVLALVRTSFVNYNQKSSKK